MKKITLIFTVVLLGALQVTAQSINWTLVNTGTNKNIRDVCFISKDTGFIAGDNGLLKLTTNGGGLWFDLPIPATGQGIGNNNNIKVAQYYHYGASVAGVLFFDKFTAINRTYDGVTWMEECGGTMFSQYDSICSINNFHHQQSYTEYTASGNCLEGGGTIGYFGGFCFTFDSLRSDTSFNGWTDITSNINDKGVVVGENGYYGLSSGGPFTLMNSGTGYNYLSVDWSDTSTVYAANDSGGWLLEKSTDGGVTFVTDSSVGPTFLYPVVAEMDFTDNDWGVMAAASNGTGGAIITKRGANVDFFMADTIMTSVYVVDSTLAYVGGLGGKLYKYDQSLGMGISSFAENIDFAIFPNPQNTNEDVLNLFVPQKVNAIIIYDMLGKVVLNENINRQGQIALNTGIKTVGTYLVRIFTDKGVGTKKYVVN